jgi:hypothetical protein
VTLAEGESIRLAKEKTPGTPQRYEKGEFFAEWARYPSIIPFWVPE